jgi:hypothetical protein
MNKLPTTVTPAKAKPRAKGPGDGMRRRGSLVEARAGPPGSSPGQALGPASPLRFVRGDDIMWISLILSSVPCLEAPGALNSEAETTRFRAFARKGGARS